ncbi:hypothetical protein [Aurantibacillus circumpalustris]|uniref:hypothetical protein n=1 Tax=Aurantibacillus circumpalustris TaxID=3036359 RepID=UPI00295AC3F9|nr:hypothetical protein [Aurantibacillus circumpalustris]
MRIPFKILISFAFLAFIALGCEEPKKEEPVVKPRAFPGYHILLDEILRSQDGVFRGINLNADPDLVKKNESVPPIEDAEEHIYYEFKADSQTNYSIDYTFAEDSLEEISVQINTDDLDLSSYLFCDLKDYYANKLPNPTEDKGQIVYNCFKGQRKPFVVSLSDNSSPSKGIINMVIYKDK